MRGMGRVCSPWATDGCGPLKGCCAYKVCLSHFFNASEVCDYTFEAIVRTGRRFLKSCFPIFLMSIFP